MSKIFISYSHKDEEWKNCLIPHLNQLKHLKLDLEVWDDRKIDVGEKWYPEIEEAMAKAAFAICLLSPDFLASDFCVKEEVPYLLDRAEKHGLHIFPILVRPCLWKAFPWISETQMLPRDGKSVNEDYKEKYDGIFTQIPQRILEITNTPDYVAPKPTPKFEPPEKIDIDSLPVTGAELFGRSKELEMLDQAWDSASTTILTFVAWGGVGKSTLINKWLEYMRQENYKGAKRVFGWSFYSQGTNEQVTSADRFINTALTWFGDEKPDEGSAWDKGVRLAGLIQQQKTLLVLDGLEPLQSAHDFERGKIKDQGLASLLRALVRNNNGLCIITTREPVADLQRYKLQQYNLDKISKEAGRALLRVGGAKSTDAELEAVTVAFGNHALAIKLIPHYLRSIPGHPISAALQIPDLDITEEKGRHPRRVIEALSKRFDQQPEADLLMLLGFFDRPAQLGAIRQLIAPPVIEGLTEHLVDRDEARLLQAINVLRKNNLLAEESQHNPDSLDCHPLIREHFGEKLAQEKYDTWQAGHGRLYEYYEKLPKKVLPDTLEEMEPLFAAVKHGCLAGQAQNAFNLYWKRIEREDEHYVSAQHGVFSSKLICLSSFFESSWDTPSEKLTEHDKASVLNWAGFALRAVGRLREAVRPTQVGLEMRVTQQNWQQAALDANNLSELQSSLGSLDKALIQASQAVMYAEWGKDASKLEICLTSFADIIFQNGNTKKAKMLFRQIEKFRTKRLPKYPYLNSLMGYQYCELLLSCGRYSDVLLRVRKTLNWATQMNSANDIALNNLSLGSAHLMQIQKTKLKDLSRIEQYFNNAVDGLLKGGFQRHIPRGLFARAAFYRYRQLFSNAWTDLDEAREIADYGEMRLHQTDYCLEAARLIQTQLSTPAPYKIIEDGVVLKLSEAEMQSKFIELRDQAEKLIEATGYHRRDAELAALKLSNTANSAKPSEFSLEKC